ncbi:hypothetical protein TraAM80_09805 [Trypanosoma rangeli]|uniref:Uncharacterized protein n=1 Tax=Trypanosoma rangeli TaxID=5698 RepID=A0A3R7N4P5_TRYRA|nr:uncharacterized protein TraAM80_09805 [Trypanosoma rangeli]RNE96425.1 hypothetical protein TraAM80_09805 [Trypanosoma rangeli]|eukprot:RNE96425.1 hypothetical protein TraAM80_09805 [Trypanosoma rangeli]
MPQHRAPSNTRYTVHLNDTRDPSRSRLSPTAPQTRGDGFRPASPTKASRSKSVLLSKGASGAGKEKTPDSMRSNASRRKVISRNCAPKVSSNTAQFARAVTAASLSCA